MELCHKLPNTNCDDVMNALSLGNKRILAESYWSGGMGDGGGCHPRDNIALSWLSRELDLSYDWFDKIMMQREQQTDWFVDLILDNKEEEDEIYILGKSFKSELNIQIGSPSILLKNILNERGHDVMMYDPYIDEVEPIFKKGVFFIGTKHPEFSSFNYPNGSTIIDPWRYVIPRKEYKVIPIGIGV